MWPTIHNGGTLFLIKHSNCEDVMLIEYFVCFEIPFNYSGKY